MKLASIGVVLVLLAPRHSTETDHPTSRFLADQALAVSMFTLTSLGCPHCAVLPPITDPTSPVVGSYTENNIVVAASIVSTVPGECADGSPDCKDEPCDGIVNIEIGNSTGYPVTYNYAGGGAPKVLQSGTVSASHDISVKSWSGVSACGSSRELDLEFTYTIPGNPPLVYSLTMPNEASQWRIGCHPCPAGPN